MKRDYEKPNAEIVSLELEESIANNNATLDTSYVEDTDGFS